MHHLTVVMSSKEERNKKLFAILVAALFIIGVFAVIVSAAWK